MSAVAVARNAANEHDTSVLDCAVGVQQLRADGSNLGEQGEARHSLQPISCDHNRVVVQKQNQFAAAERSAQIREAREVEFHLAIHDVKRVAITLLA
jgi:hypothetical protein